MKINVNEEQAEMLFTELWGRYKQYKEQAERLSVRVQENAQKHETEINRYLSGVRERDLTIKELREQIAVLKSQNAQKDANDDALTERARAIISNLQLSEAKKRDKIEALEKSLTEKENLCASHAEKIKLQGAEIEKLHKDLLDSKANIKALKEKSEGAQRCIEAMESAKKEVTALKVSNIRLRERIEYAELNGFKFPTMPEMQKYLKENKTTKITATPSKEESVTTDNIEVPNDCVRINYNVNETPCPRETRGYKNKIVNVGSKQCFDCPWFKGADREKKVVVCSRKPINE